MSNMDSSNKPSAVASLLKIKKEATARHGCRPDGRHSGFNRTPPVL